MANLNPSAVLGNVLRIIVKQVKNSDIHSNFHDTNITENLFETVQLHSMLHLEPRMTRLFIIWIWPVEIQHLSAW